MDIETEGTKSMKVFYTYQVAFWNGSCNVISDRVFTVLTEAHAYLGHSRNGCIYKTRHVEEV
jgi:hypothetical protein